MDAEAAVAVIVDVFKGEYKILFIKRRKDESDPWGGHIAFPGGMRSSRDESLIHVVYREVLEEVGIKLYRDAVLVSSLNTAYPRNAPWIKVYPYVFKLINRVKPTCGVEVEDCYWIPIGSLVRRLVKVLSSRGVVRTISYVADIDGESIIIWGMTRRILDDFLSRVDELF